MVSKRNTSNPSQMIFLSNDAFYCQKQYQAKQRILNFQIIQTKSIFECVFFSRHIG